VEFSAVMAAGNKVRGELFELHYRLAGLEARARLGLIVPKRLASSAALRNAIRRQGREAFRLMAGMFAPCDLVLRLKQPLRGINAKDSAQRRVWRTDIEDLMRRFLLR